MTDNKSKDFENQENMNDEFIENNDGAEELAGNGVGAEELADETPQLKAELAEQKDKYLRLYAEFDNYKRRTSKERIELMQTAGKEIIVSLLDVLDDWDRAEKQIQNSGDKTPALDGVYLVFNKLRSVLDARGLQPMNCVGKDFNPDEQEAITQIPAPDDSLKGKVIDEVVKGYYLNDKIIRFAKVVIGS